MTSYYVPLPAPRVPTNAMLDFSGLNEGIDDYNRRSRQDRIHKQNAMYRAKQEGRADETMGMRRTEFGQGQTDRRAKVAAGIVQGLLDAPPEQRPAMFEHLRAVDPEIDKDLRQHGLSIDTIDAWGPALLARARGYQDPAAKAKAAAVAKWQASTCPILTCLDAACGCSP